MAMDNSDLATWGDDRFIKWKTNRLPVEEKWNNNWQAFKGDRTGYWKKKEAEKWRSDTVINLTRQKCLSAYAIISDLMLQGGRIPYTLKISPWDEMNMEDQDPAQREVMRQHIEEMDAVIRQQLDDCHADRALMRNIMAGAIFGETWAKKTVIDVTRKGFEIVELPDVEDDEDIPEELVRWKKFKRTHKSPAWTYVSNWEMYWDMEEDDVQAGRGMCQSRLVSPNWLMRKGKEKFAIKSVIKEVLRSAEPSGSVAYEGNDSNAMKPSEREINHHENTIEWREFWVRAPRAKVEAFERDLPELKSADEASVRQLIQSSVSDEEEIEGDDIEVMFATANKEIAYYTRNESGDRPYFRVVWQMDLDELGGTGMADNLQDSQRSLNGAVRAFEDNKKLAGDVTEVVKDHYIKKLPKVKVPGERLHVTPECPDARMAFASHVTPDVGEGYMSAIQLFLSFIEDESLLPRISQGLDPGGDPTAFQISVQAEKAGKYMASVLRNYDEGLVEPAVTSFYNYNMDDPDLDKGKGNYIVTPTGFSSFQDRIVRLTKIQQFMGMVLTNEQLNGEAKIRELLEELAKALDLDPDQVLKSPSEKKAEQEALAQAAASDPRVQMAARAQEAEVAKIEAEAQAKVVQAQTDQAKVELEREKVELQRLELMHEIDQDNVQNKREAAQAVTTPAPAPAQPASPAGRIIDRLRRGRGNAQ